VNYAVKSHTSAGTCPLVDVSQHIVLLRGVNLVRTNRIAMGELRTALQAAGFGDVQTYLQSGNIVLSSDASDTRVATTSTRSSLSDLV
jgi:uncharacterized protein (DUF1697 family)